MANLREKCKEQLTDEMRDNSPKVYVSKAGAHYIRAEDFFRSRKGRELIKVAAKLEVEKKSK